MTVRDLLYELRFFAIAIGIAWPVLAVMTYFNQFGPRAFDFDGYFGLFIMLLGVTSFYRLGRRVGEIEGETRVLREKPKC